MPAQKTSITPIPILAGTLGVAGVAKLIGVGSVKRGVARSGSSKAGRRMVGLAEVGLAAAAVKGLGDPAPRKLAGAGTVLIMTGALATHLRAGDRLLRFLPPLLVGTLGLGTYYDVTLDMTA